MTDSGASFRYVFGPVPSRRLGRSLGVDLVPRKVCSFDCVYCQVGRTTRRTTERGHFVPVPEVLDDLRRKLATAPRPDYITLAGSGEPTLNLDLATVIDGIRRITDVPIALLTNGSLLHDPDVRRAAVGVDVALPTLDAADEATFQAVHRPAEGLTLEKVIAGLEAFRRDFAGQIWLEVFVVTGLNDRPEQIDALRAIIERINPDRIQLNTAVRPTADEGVLALGEPELEAVARRLGPKAAVIADFRRDAEPASFAAQRQEVLDTIRRRPVTLDDIAAGMGVHPQEAAKYVHELLAHGEIVIERRGEREYYRGTNQEGCG